MRRNPRRRRHRGRHHRRHMRRRHNPGGYRRRNPSTSWGAAFMADAIGGAGGIAMYGVNWGVEYIPVSDLWRSVIFGALGAATSLGLAKYADVRLGAGTMGGTSALLTGRIVTQIRMAQVAPATTTAAPAKPTTAAGVYRMNAGAGAVFRREGGAVYTREAGAVATSMRAPVFGPGFKESGASRFVPGPVRFFGPGSWAYDAGRGRRYVSAHNR